MIKEKAASREQRPALCGIPPRREVARNIIFLSTFYFNQQVDPPKCYYKVAGLLATIFMLGCAQTKAGCAQARDYVGVHHGYVNVGMKQRFGQGTDTKNYYTVNKDTVIARGDSKEEVIMSMGYPDKRERSLEGYEAWIYNENKLRLFFDKDHLKEWRDF